MESTADFKGFPKEAVRFFIDLKKNNSKTWFNANRKIYEEFVLVPAQQFVVALAKRLKKHRPELIAIPRIDRAIFRLNRDVRFTRDKSPYKTHLGIWLWEGNRPKLECPGFYMHLEPPDVMISSGLYMLPPDELAQFRRSVTEPKTGKKFRTIISGLQKKGYKFGGEYYKRLPQGFSPDSLNAGFLRFNGLYLDFNKKIPQAMHTEKWVGYCYKIYRDMLPLHEWLLKMVESSGQSFLLD
jgi:uncharacterized protein (TIGR02453 family)